MAARQVADFSKLFGDGQQSSEIFRQAVEGKLRTCSIRSVAWRYFLGALRLPLSSWGDIAAAEARKYSSLLEEHCPDPQRVAEKVEDLSISHPLSTHEASPWHNFFENSELRSEVRAHELKTTPMPTPVPTPVPSGGCRDRSSRTSNVCTLATSSLRRRRCVSSCCASFSSGAASTRSL
jgi:hypothetical protein